jgi:chromosome segregation ATPase
MLPEQKFKDMDQMFDESFARLQGKRSRLNTPYDHPFQADHQLLKKSWDYFRLRAKALEDQWKNILEAKELEVEALNQEISALKLRSEALEKENKELIEFQEEHYRSQITSLVDIEKKNSGIKDIWETQKDKFDQEKTALENQIQKYKVTLELVNQDFKKKEEIWAEKSDQLQKQILSHGDKLALLKEEWRADVQAREETLKAVQSKLDLFRSECERKDQASKDLMSALNERNHEIAKLNNVISDFQKKVEEKNTLLGNMETKNEILTREKENIKRLWEKEQAEWRELWERQRDLWDRQKQDENKK